MLDSKITLTRKAPRDRVLDAIDCIGALLLEGLNMLLCDQGIKMESIGMQLWSTTTK